MTGTANSAPQALYEKADIVNLFEQVGAPADKVESFVEIFESAVTAQANVLAEAKSKELEASAQAHTEFLNEKAAEYVELIKEEQTAKLDAYTEHFAKEFVEANRPIIESNIKANMFDTLMGDVIKLVESYNIEVSDEKADLNAELQERVQKLESDLTESQNRVVALTAQINEGLKEKVIAEAVADLTESQAEKVRGLVEEIKYTEDFSSKVSKIVEAIAKPAAPQTSKEDVIAESINTPAATPSKEVDPLMLSYVNAAKSTGSYLQ